MTLRELNAQLVNDSDVDGGFAHVDTLAEANGVRFDCPQCVTDGTPNRGLHWIYCALNGNRRGWPVWCATGTTIDDLTFTGPGPCSVKLLAGCMAHFYVRAGAIVLLAD